MQIRFHCPTDRCVAIIEYEPLEQSGPTMQCPRCRANHPIHIPDELRTANRVDRCVLCRGTEMFVRKDFPQALGVAIVVVFGLVSIYLFRINVLYSWLVLAGAVMLDLLIYLFTGKTTACYACRAEYRGNTINPAHEGFDLATSEKY